MPCKIYKLDFQEKNLMPDRDLNHGSPDLLPGAHNHRAIQVPTPAHVQTFLLKRKSPKPLAFKMKAFQYIQATWSVTLSVIYWPLYISNAYMLKVRAFGVYRFKRNIWAWAGMGNIQDSSMVKSARLVIWRSVVQIPVRVQFFLLKT